MSDRVPDPLSYSQLDDEIERLRTELDSAADEMKMLRDRSEKAEHDCQTWEMIYGVACERDREWEKKYNEAVARAEKAEAEANDLRDDRDSLQELLWIEDDDRP